MQYARPEASPHESPRPRKLSPWYAKLYKEQKDATEFILSRPATALFSQQGTGKTYITMAVLEALEPKLALIVAPLTSLDITWSPRLATLEYAHCQSTTKNICLVRSAQELKLSLKSRAGSRHPIILLINPEAIRGSAVAKRIAKLPWDIVVWDESQNVKDRNSANSRLARRLRYVPRRLALSGTPIDTSQIDVWAQMRFVDHTVFGERWGDFADEYCYRSGWMGKEWRFRKSKHKQFLHKLEEHIFRLTTDFMKLKPLVIIPTPVQMLGEQERIYDAMARDSVVTIDGVTIAAQLITTRDVKLSQITGGFVLDADGYSLPTGAAKQRKLRYLVPKLKPPLVVFCQYLHELDAVTDILRQSLKRVAILRGSVKGDARTNLIRDFQAGKIDAIVCQLRTGGVSIEFTASSTLVLYSMNYSYIDFDQILRRLHRGGQTKSVQVYMLFCVKSIDEDKIDLIKRKSELSFTVMSHFERSKRKWKK